MQKKTGVIDIQEMGGSCDVFKVKILNKEVKTVYIPALNLGNDIYAGEAIVTNSNGCANIKIFNTNEKDIKITISTVQLEEFNGHDKRISVSTQLETLDETLYFLFDAALNLQFKTISISRGPVGDVPWADHIVSDNYNWNNWLEIAMFSYNTSVHESTQYTSYELVFGQLARTPNNSSINNLRNETYAYYLEELNEQLNTS
ncbi:hypothetical protein V1478_003267 [Vespula squamosa]|uniref:Uncharacterized protein n=1 Tax=Vespula squamosa TaxID=30214 RepID=A0ABD2BS82_VESSQ